MSVLLCFLYPTLRIENGKATVVHPTVANTCYRPTPEFYPSGHILTINVPTSSTGIIVVSVQRRHVNVH